MLRLRIFCVFVIFCASLSVHGQDLDRMYIDTESHHSAMILTDGTNVVVDWITQTVTVEKPGAGTYTYSINDVVEHVESDPQLQSQLYQDISAALSEPGGSIVYLPEQDPHLGLIGGGGDGSGGGVISPDPIIRYSYDSVEILESSTEDQSIQHGTSDGVCFFMLDGTHECMPMEEPGDHSDNQFRYSNRGNGFGSLFGDTVEERECAMAHYRSWLDSQGRICDEAIALQTGAVGAGTVAYGSCRQFSRSPNQLSGLICAGSYLGFLSAAWLGNRRVNDCTADYPGPGAAC